MMHSKWKAPSDSPTLATKRNHLRRSGQPNLRSST
uniref:Uncharacterized protein n=1 Tax=Romanomermis culicivorax TaxID=13658 RepID=A0A915IG58_ROMCU